MIDLIVVYIMFAFLVFGLGLFVWLLNDVRKDNRARDQQFREERQQMLSVIQQNAVQLPAITNALQQIQSELQTLAAGQRRGTA